MHARVEVRVLMCVRSRTYKLVAFVGIREGLAFWEVGMDGFEI